MVAVPAAEPVTTPPTTAADPDPAVEVHAPPEEPSISVIVGFVWQTATGPEMEPGGLLSVIKNVV